ncbi:MAG TPA: SpoIIE family protein phosphatase [Candidatus Eisenbacteria bacterium]|nr:SpoIIE family protein phosphatase [Candidatus Eisenbacteria bacterium]
MNEKPGLNSPAAAPARDPSLAYLERDETLTVLLDVSRELTSILASDELFRRIADRVRKIVHYHLFSVLMWNEQSAHLEGVFSVHHEEAIPVRLKVPLFKGITGHAAGERRIFRVDDVRRDPRYIEFPNSENVRSELVVPLFLEDRLIGVLDLESIRVAAFTPENERMLGILSSYIAIALENSRLYAHSRNTQERLQRDLDTAREVQRQLLPQGRREIPGVDLSVVYVPARQLAGDFYDFPAYGSGRFALAVGDVSGKGTAAALYASLAVGILREYTQDHRCWPEEMLRVLNQRLCAANMTPSYVALLFAVYDASLRQLMIANAGEPRPILMRGGEVAEIQVDGTPLGMFDSIDYEELTLALQPGDLIVFASDGILESTNDESEHFGFDRLAVLLRELPPSVSADSISAAILKATDEFSGHPEEAHDDRTLVVLRLL